MAKKTDNKRTEVYRVMAKPAPYILLPSNALDADFYRRTSDVVPLLELADGVVYRPTFVAGWDNSDGRYDEDLDSLCQSKFGAPFSFVKSIWFSRLGFVESFWHLIKI